jgi:lipoprotein-anchoring transpeptidase ErfK/SrfK
MRHIQHITAGLLALLLAACSNDPRTGRDTQYLGRAGQAVTRNGPAYDTVSYWDGDAAHGAPSIVIDLGEQKAFYYKGGELVGVSVISTGREGYGTPTGHFHIIQKDKDHKSTLYGDYVDAQGNVLKKDIDIHKDPKPPGAIFDGAKMPNFLRIVGGTGMHAGFLPGYPASHGCIRMPAFMAEAFFKNTPTGTPVEIRN